MTHNHTQEKHINFTHTQHGFTMTLYKFFTVHRKRSHSTSKKVIQRTIMLSLEHGIAHGSRKCRLTCFIYKNSQFPTIYAGKLESEKTLSVPKSCTNDLHTPLCNLQKPTYRWLWEVLTLWSVPMNLVPHTGVHKLTIKMIQTKWLQTKLWVVMKVGWQQSNNVILCLRIMVSWWKGTG